MAEKTAVGEFSITCPIPIDEYPAVTLAHGGGGRLMNQLIEKMFLSVFGSPSAPHDSVVLKWPHENLVFTTDSFVVRPLFFPGGDIGELAVYGTVNDLAMSGARPLYLSAGFILEEGLCMEILWKVVQSMKRAADRVGIEIVTGDTKVVDRGKGDGIYINTSGVGVREHNLNIHPSSLQGGDAVILSGDLGRHGMAIMAVREGLEFESEIKSDAAPLAGIVLEMIEKGIEIHCLRDLTRGGLVSALNEIASAADKSITITEEKISVREDVQAACEILGLDPLHVANEGRFVAFVAQKDAGRAQKIIASFPDGAGAAVIGEVTAPVSAPVTMKSRIGSVRVLDMLSGEQLPRIC